MKTQKIGIWIVLLFMIAQSVGSILSAFYGDNKTALIVVSLIGLFVFLPLIIGILKKNEISRKVTVVIFIIIAAYVILDLIFYFENIYSGIGAIIAAACYAGSSYYLTRSSVKSTFK